MSTNLFYAPRYLCTPSVWVFMPYHPTSHCWIQWTISRTMVSVKVAEVWIKVACRASLLPVRGCWLMILATSPVYNSLNQHTGTLQRPFATRLLSSKLGRMASDFLKVLCILSASHHWTKLWQRQNHLSGSKVLIAHCNSKGLLLHSCKAKSPSLLYLIFRSLASVSPPNVPQDHCLCHPQDFK